jgi:N-acetylneuraminic acid mutarotase
VYGTLGVFAAGNIPGSRESASSWTDSSGPSLIGPITLVSATPASLLPGATTLPDGNALAIYQVGVSDGGGSSTVYTNLCTKTGAVVTCASPVVVTIPAGYYADDQSLTTLTNGTVAMAVTLNQTSTGYTFCAVQVGTIGGGDAVTWPGLTILTISGVPSGYGNICQNPSPFIQTSATTLLLPLYFGNSSNLSISGYGTFSSLSIGSSTTFVQIGPTPTVETNEYNESAGVVLNDGHLPLLIRHESSSYGGNFSISISLSAISPSFPTPTDNVINTGGIVGRPSLLSPDGVALVAVGRCALQDATIEDVDTTCAYISHDEGQSFSPLSDVGMGGGIDNYDALTLWQDGSIGLWEASANSGDTGSIIGYSTLSLQGISLLWLFGGQGYDAGGNYGYLNDLWEYKPSAKEWAWMSGSSTVPQTISGNPGVYGTLGTFAAGNIPGGRDSAASWTDSSGNFWLFGGEGYAANGNGGNLNDLWNYKPSTNQWAWIGGSSTAGQYGVYGTLGTFAAGNIPGSRASASSWTDSSGNFWLFGGWGAGGTGYLNDLWEYKPSAKEWAWMGGSSTVSHYGVYGTLGTFAAGNIPGSRGYASSWTDSSGNLWLFGGLGFDAGGSEGNLNDLWEYKPSTNEWAWMSGGSMFGSNGGLPGEYGTLGTFAAGNIPGGRYSASSWTDSSGHHWLFGGAGYDANEVQGILNDLWKCQPLVTLSATAAPTFSLAAGTYTTTQTVTISDATPGAVIYYTTNGTTPTTSSTVYSGPITVSSTETLEAIATATGYTTSAVASAAYTITPPAATPTVSVAAGTYNSVQTVTISDATPGAVIYYTTNGTTPTTSSTVYSGPITISSSETLEAIATATGYTTSAVASAAYTISIPTNPVPLTSGITPAFASAGGTAFTLTVNGSGFTAGSTVYWGTSALVTTFGSATQLTAQVPATDIATGGITVAITVITPSPGGGTSNSFQFEVDSATGTTTGPQFSSVTQTVTAGSPASYPVTLPSTVESATVTCLNLPTGASCSYSAATNTVTIATSPTTPAGTYLVTVVFTETVTSAAFLLPILLLPLGFMRRKLAARGIWLTACLGLVLMASAALSIGCGSSGGGGSGSSTPPSTQQVTSSGSVSLTVQ